jgi:diguanylate cyclase (GGDEF)-like protein/PAS domain S-box-containing protein
MVMRSSRNFDQQIYSDKLATLYSSNWLSTAATLVVASTYVGVQLPYHDMSHLFIWLAFIVTIYAYRFFLTRNYFRTPPPPEEQADWLMKFRIVIFITGLTLGSTVIFFYPYDDVPRQMFTILILAGMAAGGLTVLVADLVCFRGYVFSVLLPASIYSVIKMDTIHISVALLLSIFLFTILRASRRLNDIVTSSLQLRYENLSLVTILEQEKSQLNNRLGRILNDSSNELYIADAATLRYLQVNKGSLENLGFTEAEMSGMTLLDILIDLNESVLKRLISPLHTGTTESITYQTLQKRKDGSTYPAELRFQLSSKEKPPVLVVTALDITERNEAEQKLIHQANFDQLTNLPNRYYMMAYIESAFARARRQHSKVSLLFMDLDNFKDINDTLGHRIGDALLQQVAVRIRSLLRETDTAARLGGDEFLVLLEELQEQYQAALVVNKLSQSFIKPFLVHSHEIYTSVTIGISTYPDDGDSVELLMQYADTAMYHAKQEDNLQYRFFSKDLRDYIDEQLSIEKRLRHALDNDELSVYYQPKFNTRTETIMGAEALIRWTSPDLGNVSPGVFIPIAEKYGLIEDIGAWVLKTACEEARCWQEIAPEAIQVAVNVSPQQFRSNNFLEIVDAALQTSGLPGRLLEIEITENLLMQDTEAPFQMLTALQKKNITLALDDFGKGYSSLSYLKRFPLQVLKIDRSFIYDMMENQHNMSLVDAIIAMAKALDLNLVAEGVETKAQLDFMRNRMVEIVQGYLFSPAVPAQEFQALIQRGPCVRHYPVI